MKSIFSTFAIVVLMMGPLSAQADGQTVYEGSCKACHIKGLMGAPLITDKAAWGPRIEKGIDALTATVITGKPPMPPRGACVDCSDADIRAAVEYMVEIVK